MCKRDDSSPQQKSRFFIENKGVGLSLDVLPLRNALKRALQNNILLVRFIISQNYFKLTT